MKRKQILLLPLCTLLALSGLFSCGVDRWPEYYPLTGRDLWIDSVMREDYLWYDEIPAFDDLNYFQSPQEFLNQIKSDKDEFSTVDTLSTVPVPSYGFDYSLSQVPDNDTAYYAQVTYVIPDSPASEAGLERGDWIMMVDNDYITKKNEDVLKEGGSKDIVIGQYTLQPATEGEEAPTGVVTKDRDTVLPASRAVNDVVVPVSKILDGGVGYIVYNSFQASADAEVGAFTRQCAESGVKDLVIDLRYNAGGDMESVRLWAAALVPSANLGSTLASLTFNQKQSARNGDISIDPNLLQAQGGSNLNLSTVYFLTSGTTAGASEMLINCLKPYMNVVMVGETTKGEYLATAGYLNESLRVVLRPVVCEVYNANGAADYTAGFLPQYTVNGLDNPAQVLPLGNPDEALLSTALGVINGTITPDTGTDTDEEAPTETRIKRTFRKGLILP